ncbi:2-dehydropantoate 2-reductase [Niveispirillum sp.]|uniref:2-dehydropantoate 2-reductase n=1 Tax=Niveispirillum sp. TaxID=1917217 RepID=UPI001B4437D6|nr:2-dehydropantoate 2-reductase [Niveispirillum sp.]MBP7337136.1 2-dehydropantoate 2-reductase [Niveispirillum sp.]
MRAGRRILIAGAGSVGCYAGGCLALAGRPVTLLGRPALMQRLADAGLRVSDLDGRDRVAPAGPGLRLDTDQDQAMADAGLILVTVKCADTAAMADLIADHAPPDALVISCQNGIGNADILAARLGAHRVLAGMVPFNIVQLPDGRFHRGTGGQVMIQAGQPGVRQELDVPGLHVDESADMQAVLWGKLLINLNNALNALCGLPLARELGARPWRVLLARQQWEGLRALKRAGIKPATFSTVPPPLLPWILCLPDALFRVVARRMLAIDPLARSSMWEDLERRRPTEIGRLQGAVIDLAQRHGLDAPVNRRVRDLIQAAEAAGQGSPGLSADAVGGR